VAEIVGEYLTKKANARSAEAMRFSWQALKPHFGHYRPDQITPELCQAYAKSRRVSDGTIIKDLGLLRTSLKGKGGEFWLPHTPPPRDRYLTRSEFDRLLKATSLPHIRLFMALALATGARAGAILGLTWDRVDFARGNIKLADGRSGGKGRATVPMNNAVREALVTAHKGRTGDWVIEWAGRSVKSVKRAFREACARAGLEAVTPHVLRHTAAVWMIEAGASITEVAQYLGHTDTRTTFRVYARHSPDHLRKAAKALEF
jgi:integrase